MSVMTQQPTMQTQTQKAPSDLNNTQSTRRKRRTRAPMKENPKETVVKPYTQPINPEFTDDMSPEYVKKWERFVKQFDPSTYPNIASNEFSYSMRSLFAANVSNMNKKVVEVNSETAIGIATGILSHALTLGYRQKVMAEDKGNYLYFAFMFIYNTVLQVMMGNQSNVPKVKMPDFFLEILAAIQPKMGIQSAAGILGYSWSVNNSSYQPSRSFGLPQGLIPYGNYVIGLATSGLEQGYNVMSTSGPAYDPEEVKNAIQDLFYYVDASMETPEGHYHPYALRDYALDDGKCIMSRSTSAFASSNLIVGGGIKGGFIYSLAALESTILHPKFSIFADPSQDIRRGLKFHKTTGGDTNWLVCSLLNQQYRREFKNPNFTIFKPVDFFEFAHRFAMVLARCMQYYIDDESFENQFTGLGININEYVIILRKIILPSFPLQYGVQSLRFYSDADEFVPLLVSTATTCSDQMSQVTLPLFFKENLNALAARSLLINYNPANGQVVKSNPKIYVPVLGRYTNATLSPDDYTVTIGEQTSSIFNPGALQQRLVVDGSFNGKFIDLDTSPKIQQDLAEFNKKIDQLKPWIQAPTQLGGDAGVPPLSVIADSLFVQSATVRTKTGEEKHLEMTVANKRAVAYITQHRPFRDIYSIKKAFVTPEYRVTENDVEVGNVDPQLIRVFNGEAWIEEFGQKFVSSDEGTMATLDSMREQWISYCTKLRTADDDTTVKQLTALSEAGNAGILGSLVATFGGELTKTAVSTLANYIPI